jgi:hypothetical protein
VGDVEPVRVERAQLGGQSRGRATNRVDKRGVSRMPRVIEQVRG